MTLKRGDVVIVHYPFSSGTGTKLRPALVVQCDRNNRRLTNVILTAITTTTHHVAASQRNCLWSSPNRRRTAVGPSQGFGSDL